MNQKTIAAIKKFIKENSKLFDDDPYDVDPDRIMVYLRAGLQWEDERHVTGFETFKDFKECLKYVQPCTCAYCKERLLKIRG